MTTAPLEPVGDPDLTPDTPDAPDPVAPGEPSPDADPQAEPAES